MAENIVIVGGGVVGLNIALALVEGPNQAQVYLFEREPFLGNHTSTRNSEVIHAGFAYPPGSLKSRLCIEGNRLSFELLDRLKMPYHRNGKWIVAHDSREVTALEAMMANAAECSVPGMRLADLGEVAQCEPSIACPVTAAFSSTSGIIDCSAYIRALEVALSAVNGVHIVYPCAVEGIDTGLGILSTNRGEMPFDLLINAAGLFADDVYRMAGGKRRYEIRPFKGEYYIWRDGNVKGLVYPVPHRFLSDGAAPHQTVQGDASKISSMGVHLHRSVAGELFIGPTEVPLPSDAKTDYTICTTADEISRMVSPLLRSPPDPLRLREAFAGNRPKLYEDGEPVGDFVIFKEGNVIHLLGIESPGLTAAPAIARLVVQKIK